MKILRAQFTSPFEKIRISKYYFRCQIFRSRISADSTLFQNFC